jgi:hypothetical protein
MWPKIKKFGEGNWKFLLITVLVIGAAFWVYPVAKKYVDCMPTAAAPAPVVASTATSTTTVAPVSVLTAAIPGVPDTKKVGATTDDLARSYQTVDFEGQKKGMAMQGVTFLDYGQLMEFAHKSIADGAAAKIPLKKPAPPARR